MTTTANLVSLSAAFAIAREPTLIGSISWLGRHNACGDSRNVKSRRQVILLRVNLRTDWLYTHFLKVRLVCHTEFPENFTTIGYNSSDFQLHPLFVDKSNKGAYIHVSSICLREFLTSTQRGNCKVNIRYRRGTSAWISI